MLNFKKFSPKQLWILVLLVPALILLLRSLLGNVFVNEDKNDFYSIKITDSRENVFLIDSKSFPEDVSNLINLFSSAEPTDVKSFDGASTISLEISSKDGATRNVNLFFVMPRNENESVMCAYLKDGKFYVAQNEYSDFFASADYALSLYSFSIPPMLVTHSLDTVIPSSISWNYKSADKTFNKVSTLETTSKNNVYFQNGKMDFSFSVPPTYADITISNDDTAIYSGSLDGLAEQNIDVSGKLYVSINARWDSSDDSPYFGNASYNFTMQYMAPAQFSVSKASVSSGGFIALEGVNISDCTKIKISFEPKLLVTPRIIPSDTSALALIPIPFDTQYKSITLTVSYGEITENIAVSLEPISPQDPVKIKVDQELIDKYHSNDSVTEFREVLTSVCQGNGLDKALFSNFEDPAKDIGTTLLLSAGEVYQVNGLYSSTSIENHYSMSYGAPVRSLCGGAIDSVGFCDNLGNYVVVDHGMGIRTWYSHLSEITLKKGDLVNSGDIIGRAGNSGYAFTCGTSIFCTMGYTTVSINEIIKNGILFSE